MNEKERAMLDMINAERMARGRPALRGDERLTAAARGHAADMALHPGLVHIGSDGRDQGQRIAASGYRAAQYSEVVGWGFGGDTGPMVDWWLNSPAHVGWVLDPDMADCGVGYATGLGPWGHYWCVDFARGDSVTHTVYAPVVVGPAPAQSLDLLDYLRGDGRAYMVQHPNGSAEKFRTVHDGARWLQLKNSQWEEFWADESHIWRGVDTSPGDDCYYRQWEEREYGDELLVARWCPRRMAVGESWRAPVQHRIQTYRKVDCSPVEHHRNGRATNALTLAARHDSCTWNGVTVRDVIELVTHTGEHMYYGRGYGLVAWASSWGQSAISYELPPNEADNQPEHGCFG